jgi:hypothetical protein
MIETFLREIVDYAGLFPPAGLELDLAVKNFADYRQSTDRWMLGRFVVPLGRLERLRETAFDLASISDPWPVSVLIPGPVGDGAEFLQGLQTIVEFNQQNPALLIDSIETKLETLEVAEHICSLLPPQMQTFWEIDLNDQRDDKIRWLQRVGRPHSAKIRTGGVQPSMIPSVAQVAEFLRACAEHEVPFKATAGLHHPIRNDFRLTYAVDAPQATLHGFLNVFIAALLAKTHFLTAEQIAIVLSSQSSTEFVIADDRVGWGMWFVEPWAVEELRRTFAISFGSCSFTEPTCELRQLGFMPLHQLG